MTPTIEHSTRLNVSPQTVGSEVDQEIMLMSIASGQYYGLDSVGSEIWRRLQKETSFADLAAGLQSHFKGDEATIEAEAREFVARLVDKGLVQLAADATDTANKLQD